MKLAPELVVLAMGDFALFSALFLKGSDHVNYNEPT